MININEKTPFSSMRQQCIGIIVPMVQFRKCQIRDGKILTQFKIHRLNVSEYVNPPCRD